MTTNMTPAEQMAWEKLAETGLLRRALALDSRDYKRALQRAVVIVLEGKAMMMRVGELVESCGQKWYASERLGSPVSSCEVSLW